MKSKIKKVTKAPKKTKKTTNKSESKPVSAKEKKIKKSESVAADLGGGDDKQKVIKDFALKEGDTGSPEVQVAIATQKIINLTKHLEQNPKDNHSRRGLLKVIAKRRRILNYLQKKDEKRYTGLIKKLGLKK